MRQLQITCRKSMIGRRKDQRDTMRALGLRRISQTVIHPDTPTIRGMIAKVSHLVEVKALDEEEKTL